MITILSGKSLKLNLKRHSVVTLSNGAGTASITVDGEVIANAHTGTKKYGPFPTGGKAVITATVGDVDYQITNA